MKNKFGYDMDCIKEDVCDMAVCDGKSCNHYYSKYCLQQLKAEISSINDRLIHCKDCDLESTVVEVIKQIKNIIEE